MNTYVFTEEQIERIEQINNLLIKEQKWLLNFTRKTRALLRDYINLKKINDYEFYYVLKVFSNNSDCNQRNKVDQGKPIYTMRRNLSSKETDSFFLTDDWSGNYLASQSHAFSKFHFCYSMHCIVFHSGLSWEDILQIDTVWVDMKVDFQFMIDIKSSKKEVSELNIIKKVTEIIHVPQLIEDGKEVTILKWNKNIGDYIERGDSLVELETEEATFDLESYERGVLLHKAIDEGGKLKVDDVLAVIGIYKRV